MIFKNNSKLKLKNNQIKIHKLKIKIQIFELVNIIVVYCNLIK